MPINIREVARLSGVSPAAVSLALRGRSGVSEKTRQHILEVAEKNGYRPNPMVSALMTQVGARLRNRVNSIIGLITNFNLDNYPFHSTPHLFFSGMREAANAEGYLLESFIFDPSTKNLPLARMLEARNIRGLIIHLSMEELNRLDIDLNRFACVALGYPHIGRSIDFVCNDHGHSARLAIDNLVRLGYRRIGLALNGQRPEHVESSMLGAMLAWQYKYPENAIRPLTQSTMTPESLLEWIKNENPDAIMTNDHVLYNWIKESGIEVPRQIAFAHLDVDENWKNISGVNQNNKEVGNAALRLLTASINTNRFGPAAHTRTVKIRGHWVSGETAIRH